MAKTEEYKDGVTLMAEAIRREREEEKKKAEEEKKKTNVSQATAQFSNKSTAPAEPKNVSKGDDSKADDGKADDNKGDDGEPDGTI